MGTQTAIAELIQARGADYELAVKDNQPQLPGSIEDFWKSFLAHPANHTPHGFAQTVEKDHGHIETRHRTVFDLLVSSLLRRGPLRSPNLAHPDSGTLPQCTGVCLSAKDGTILAGLCRCFRWQQPLPAFPRAAGRTIRFWTLR